MKSARLMNVTSVVVCVFAVLPTVELTGRNIGPRFERVGPAETARLEKTLRARLGVYGWGIWPRSEKFAGAVRGQTLPKRYVERLKTWIPRILKKDLLPEVMDPNEWHGLRKLDGYSDFIVGRWQNMRRTGRVEFRADGTLLVVTVVSDEYFPNGVTELTNDEIVEAITGLVNYPEDEIEEITIEKQFEEMGDPNNKTLVCYGKLRAPEPTVPAPPPKRRAGRRGTKPESIVPEPPRQRSEKPQTYRTWWSFMPFWMTKNKIFFCASTVESKRPLASLDWYVFKFPEAGKPGEQPTEPKK